MNECVTVKTLAGFFQCNGGKLTESEGYMKDTTAFSSFLVC